MTDIFARERTIRMLLPAALFVLWMTYVHWAGTWLMWVVYALCAFLLIFFRELFARERIMVAGIAVLGIVHAALFQSVLLYGLNGILMGVLFCLTYPARRIWIREWAVFFLLWILFFDGYYAGSLLRANFWIIWCAVIAGVAYAAHFLAREHDIRGNGWRKAAVAMLCAESFLVVSFFPFSYAILAFVSTSCSVFLFRYGLLRFADEGKLRTLFIEAGACIGMIGALLFAGWLWQR